MDFRVCCCRFHFRFIVNFKKISFLPADCFRLVDCRSFEYSGAIRRRSFHNPLAHPKRTAPSFHIHQWNNTCVMCDGSMPILVRRNDVRCSLPSFTRKYPVSFETIYSMERNAGQKRRDCGLRYICFDQTGLIPSHNEFFVGRRLRRCTQ